MKRIAVINFTGFRGNWGCQATSFELVKFIGGLFPPDAPLSFDYVPLLPGSRVDRAYDGEIDKVFAAFTDVARQTDRAASATAYLAMACEKRYGFWADIVKRADLVVFQAEGSMGLGADFARGPRLMLLPFVARHAWGRRVISLNQTFYSHDERIVQNAAETFSTLDFAGFREGASVALARQSGVPDAAYVPDLAFMTQAAGTMPVPDMGSKGEYFAVSGSALKDPDRYNMILAQAERIRDATGLKPMIAVSRDLKMKLQARHRWARGDYLTVPSGLSYSNVARLLAKSRFLIGGRYHMTIMAAAVGTPNIILTGNSFKNEGLASLLHLGRPVRDFSDADGIVSDARAIIAHEGQERARLADQIDLIRKTIVAAQEHLTGVIEGRTMPRFVDDLPSYQFDPVIMERYRQYGRGKTKPSRFILPGARLGRAPTDAEALRPLCESFAGDGKVVVRFLIQLAQADAKIAAYLKKNTKTYPWLRDVIAQV